MPPTPTSDLPAPADALDASVSAMSVKFSSEGGNTVLKAEEEHSSKRSSKTQLPSIPAQQEQQPIQHGPAASERRKYADSLVSSSESIHQHYKQLAAANATGTSPRSSRFSDPLPPQQQPPQQPPQQQPPSTIASAVTANNNSFQSRPIAPSLFPLTSQPVPSPSSNQPYIPTSSIGGGGSFPPVNVLPPLTPELRETIEKVVAFCAQHGPATVTSLRNKEGAEAVMPFLFERSPFHAYFLGRLKAVLGMPVGNNIQNTVGISALAPTGPPGGINSQHSNYGAPLNYGIAGAGGRGGGGGGPGGAAGGAAAGGGSTRSGGSRMLPRTSRFSS